jgi:quinoprotein glucose dehydrogenase
MAAANDPHLSDSVAAALKDNSPELRSSAIRVGMNMPNGIEQFRHILDTGTIPEKQAVLDGLGEVKSSHADPILAQWMDKYLAGQVQSELQLDLLESAAKRQDAQVAERYKKYQAGRDPNNPLWPYRECMTGGNAANGRVIFRERADVSCMRCHTAQGEGGIVGPRLDGIGAKQNREYLLESIVNPNAKIAQGFESLIVQTKQGKFRVGVLKEENDKQLVLMNPDKDAETPIIIIPKEDIKSRDRGPSAMPEGMARTLSKRDLRDLVEFLASLK